MIIILSPIYYLGFLMMETWVNLLGIAFGPLLGMLISVWIIYSIFEAIGLLLIGERVNEIILWSVNKPCRDFNSSNPYPNNTGKQIY